MFLNLVSTCVFSGIQLPVHHLRDVVLPEGMAGMPSSA